MMLSALQVKLIRDQVNIDRLTIETLKDDLIDHLCCEVEQKLSSGKSFEDCLKEAVSDVAPQGFMKIQEETSLLLNAKKMTRIKKLTFIFGLLSTMSCCL